jgi:translation initiation factor 4E
MYNNIAKVADIPIGSNYHLFKEGVKPAWEDSENEKGGKWVVGLGGGKVKGEGGRASDLDHKWLSLVIHLFVTAVTPPMLTHVSTLTGSVCRWRVI